MGLSGSRALYNMVFSERVAPVKRPPLDSQPRLTQRAFVKEAILKEGVETEAKEEQQNEVPQNGDSVTIVYALGTGGKLGSGEYNFDVVSSQDTHKDICDTYLSDMVKTMRSLETALFTVNISPAGLLGFLGSNEATESFTCEIELRNFIPGPHHISTINWFDKVKKKITKEQIQQQPDLDLYILSLGIPSLFRKNLFLTENFKLPDFIAKCSMERREKVVGSDPSASVALDQLQLHDDEKNTFKSTLKIKLLITDIAFKPDAFGFLLPFVLKAEQVFANTTYGFVHTALQIGPWLLEWNKTELVIPRCVSDITAIAALDLNHAPISDLPSLNKTLDIVTQVCTRWNRKENYTTMKYNCQLFVDELLGALGIKTNFTGALNEFLKGVKENADWGKKFVTDNNTILFESHEQLDSEVLRLRAEGKLTADDELLLKSFDRAYWCQYRDCLHMRQEAEMYKEVYDATKENECRPKLIGDDAEGACGCAFDNPWKTLSFV